MTTYPIEMPTLGGIESIVLSMEFVNAVSKSPFTLGSQVYDWGGMAWKIDSTLPSKMKRDTAEEWIAFALSLRGRKGTFLAGDPSGRIPRGVGGGTPLVKGAGQTGSTLLVDGCPISTTNWLKKGDYFQLGTGSSARLHKLIENANTNASGEVTLEFVPTLRTSPADNAPLIITNAKGLFRMDSNTVPWTADGNGQFYSYSFTATEDL